jgi:hypothetical protein
LGRVEGSFKGHISVCVPFFVGLGRVERSFKSHVITHISFIEGSGRVEGLRVMPLSSSVLVPIPLPMTHSLTYAQCLKD